MDLRTWWEGKAQPIPSPAEGGAPLVGFVVLGKEVVACGIRESAIPGEVSAQGWKLCQ